VKLSLKKNSIKLILLRHFITKWNKEGKIQGLKNNSIIPPSKKTLYDVKRKLNHFKSIKNIDIYTSNLKRTIQTANYLKLNFKKTKILNEIDVGKFEGLPREKFYLHVDFDNKNFLKKNYVESKLKIINRIKKLKKNIKRDTLIISHGIFIKLFLSYLKYGKISQFKNFKMNNSEIKIINLDI